MADMDKSEQKKKKKHLLKTPDTIRQLIIFPRL